MKKTLQIVFLIGILTFINSCKAQINSEKSFNAGLPKELFQRWKLDYGIAYGEKISGLPQPPSNDYEFLQNGEYFLYNSDETFVKGTWEYNRDEKTIYTKNDNGELNGKITDMKAESIVLVPAGKAVEGTFFENFRFYYIPKNN